MTAAAGSQGASKPPRQTGADPLAVEMLQLLVVSQRPLRLQGPREREMDSEHPLAAML